MPSVAKQADNTDAEQNESAGFGNGDGGGSHGGRPDEPVRIREDSETEALRLVIQHGPALNRIDPVLFRDGVTRRALEAVIEAEGDIHRAIEDSEPGAADLLTRLAVSESTAEIDDVMTLLATEATTRVLRRLESDARTAPDSMSYAHIMGWLKLRLDDLGGDQPSMEAVDELLAWLKENSGELR